MACMVHALLKFTCIILEWSYFGTCKGHLIKHEKHSIWWHGITMTPSIFTGQQRLCQLSNTYLFPESMSHLLSGPWLFGGGAKQQPIVAGHQNHIYNIFQASELPRIHARPKQVWSEIFIIRKGVLPHPLAAATVAQIHHWAEKMSP